MIRKITRKIAILLTAVMILVLCAGCGDLSNLPEESSVNTSATVISDITSVSEGDVAEFTGRAAAETHEIGYVEIYEEYNLNVEPATPSVTDEGYYIPYGLTVTRDESNNCLVLSWKCDAPGNRGGKDKFEIIIMHLTHNYTVIQTEILMQDGVFEYTLGNLSQGAYRIYVHTMNTPNKVEGRNMSITFQVY